MKIVKSLLQMTLAGYVGSLLGGAANTRTQQRGLSLGPVRVVPTNVLPAIGVGLVCGGSSIFSLLSGFVLGALVGDRFEQE